LYRSGAKGASKSATVLVKSIPYFGIGSIKIGTEKQELRSFISEKYPSLSFDTPPYDMIFLSIYDWPGIRKEYSDGQLIHNQTLIVLDDIHNDKQANTIWKSVVSSFQFNVSIDLFHCGLLFPRREQRKEHFKIRI
jgi:hypothetical protein